VTDRSHVNIAIAVLNQTAITKVDISNNVLMPTFFNIEEFDSHYIYIWIE